MNNNRKKRKSLVSLKRSRYRVGAQRQPADFFLVVKAWKFSHSNHELKPSMSYKRGGFLASSSNNMLHSVKFVLISRLVNE